MYSSSSSYVINFSDSSKPTITIPGMPPGINSVDTSLDLVGRGYPDYGRKISENFLHLLENFAGPFPGPRQPIEGQLWYDTTDPYNKVLRLRDGANWVSANGIYQQGTDPRLDPVAPANLKIGDIWVDTANLVLKIYNNTGWTTVGPLKTGASTAGIEVDNIDDNQVTPEKHNIVKVWAEGEVIAVVTAEQFTPRIGIPGFSTLLPGINLRETAVGPSVPSPIFNGTALSSRNLEVESVRYPSSSFLRKDDQIDRSQVITGKVYFNTPKTGSGFGIVINNESSTTDDRYIQFYKENDDAVIRHNDPNGKILFRISSGLAAPVQPIAIDRNSISLSLNTSITGNLTVSSGVTANRLTVSTGGAVVNASMTVTGSLLLGSDIEVGNRIRLLNSSTSAVIEPAVSDLNDIGLPNKRFRNLYVNEIGSTSSNAIVYGKVIGTSGSLENATQFMLMGQVVANTFNFTGRQETPIQIATAARSGGIATIVTQAPHGITGTAAVSVVCNDATFNATNTATTVLSPTSFSYSNPGSDASVTSKTGVVYYNQAIFTTELAPGAIADQESTSTASVLTFIGLNTATSTLHKVTFDDVAYDVVAAQPANTGTVSSVDLLGLNTQTNSLERVPVNTVISSLLFPGMITQYGSGTTPPPGWLFCDGSLQSASEFPDLFAVIGYDYGGAFGNFNVPDLSGLDNNSNPIFYIIKT